MYKIFSLLLLLATFSAGSQNIEQKAAEIHNKVFTLDSHTDTPLKFYKSDFDIGEKHDGYKGQGKIDIPRMEEGGLDAVFFAVFIGQGNRDNIGNKKAYAKAEQIFDAVYETVEKNQDRQKSLPLRSRVTILKNKGRELFTWELKTDIPLVMT